MNFKNKATWEIKRIVKALSMLRALNGLKQEINLAEAKKELKRRGDKK